MAQRTFQDPQNPIFHEYEENQNNKESRKEARNKIIEKIEKMTDTEIDKVSKQLDKLVENEQSQKPEEESQIEKEEFDLEAEEINDQVYDLPKEDKNTGKYRSVSEISVYGSKVRSKKSRSSQRSSQTYILKLKRELDTEREERMKLE